MAYSPSYPHSFPHPFGGSGSGAARDTGFADLVWRIGPPWLQRTWSKKILASIAAPLDTLAFLMSAGVRARFPSWEIGDALVVLGRERRIRRGPTESPAIYASRLVRWLDDHRGRGGAYALLGQLRAFWAGTHDGTHAVVSHRGVRHTSVGDVITRDVITWTADGTAAWAQFWVMLHVSADPRPIDDATYLAVPVDWSAAHVLREHVIVLWGHGRLWEYPPPSGTWTEWETGLTWDAWDADAPFELMHEET